MNSRPLDLSTSVLLTSTASIKFDEVPTLSIKSCLSATEKRSFKNNCRYERCKVCVLKFFLLLLRLMICILALGVG